MKFTENSLVVDVVKISNSSFKLSVPAGDLLTAAMNGAVLRRHDLSTAVVPNVLYVPLSEAKLSSGTYTFTFASGDKFTASTADAYPAASSVSDNTDSELPAVGANDKNKFLHTNESTGDLEWATAGGSGGGVLVVNGTWNEAGTECTLDKTWQEIYDADLAIWNNADSENKDTYICVNRAVDPFANKYSLIFSEAFGTETYQYKFYADSASGYPVYSA